MLEQSYEACLNATLKDMGDFVILEQQQKVHKVCFTCGMQCIYTNGISAVDVDAEIKF